MDKKMEQLRSKNPDEILSVLEEFNKKNMDLFNFAELHTNEDDQWYNLWQAVFSILNDASLAAQHPICLNTVRILTRDEFSLIQHDIGNELDSLLKLAHLIPSPYEIKIETNEGASAAPLTEAKVLDVTATRTIAESLKCLCNLVFQSSECRRQCVKKNVVDAIIKRVSSPTEYPTAVELFDMKLMFLLTALEPTARNRVQIDLNGITYLTECLDEKLSESQYDDEKLDLLCEMLKVMFNITSSPDKSPNENEIQSLHLTGVIRELILRFGSISAEKERNVIMHAVNLLTNISSSCLLELTKKHNKDAPETSQVLVYEGRNVRVLEVLLRYLHMVLDEQENSASSNELVSPVLTVLVKCVRCNSTMRHYIRKIILPPLRDVSQRPEVGSELRNHLCRFLTMPAMILRDLTAELLFVCCKENVARMVKYTGYGNAAGLFANRGVLDCRRVENEKYSSDSEDSDTEEYKKVQHNINPVVGCYEPSKRSPLEGMSEEQKEYESFELVKLMDKLHKSGIIQPCRIGEDGKPQPVDHILQLQDELIQQQFEEKQKK